MEYILISSSTICDPVLIFKFSEIKKQQTYPARMPEAFSLNASNAGMLAFRYKVPRFEKLFQCFLLLGLKNSTIESVNVPLY